MPPPQIIQDRPGEYHFETKDRQRISIEHKNQQITLTLFKWMDETSFEMILNPVMGNHQFTGNRIEVETPARVLRVYPIDTRSTGELYGDTEDDVQCHDGGVRFEIVFKSKPPINRFIIPVKSRSLQFLYQPPLSEEEVNQGARRPLNVVGSYAVYHTSKKDNEYMTGKAFHLYRPIAVDALGVMAWCALELDKQVTNLTLTVPQQFLDEATYPVTVDPDFGYTTIGGSSGDICFGNTSSRRGSAWVMPAPGGTANYIRARILGQAGSGTCDCKVLINQKDSGGAGKHGQIAIKENLACAEAEHWEQFTLASEALTSGVVYILNIVGKTVASKTSYYVRYDTNGAVASYYTSYAYGYGYTIPDNPWVVNPEATKKDYSIYCNYTAAAAGGLKMIPSLKGHMGYDLKTRGGKARRRIF